MPNPAPPTNDHLLLPLHEAIKSGRCVAIIGAGMSRPDYPDWSSLISSIATQCPEDFIYNTDSESLLDIADRIRVQHPTIYANSLRKQFIRKDNVKCASRYHYLARIPFHHYLTTNYDPVLIDTHNLHKDVIYSAYPDLPSTSMKKGHICHLHGYADPDGGTLDVDHLVLTHSDFTKAYDPDQSFLSTFLRTIFHEYSVCFLGCGFKDEFLPHLIKCCHSLRQIFFGWTKPNCPRWYAVVDSESDAAAFNPDETGIQPVRYSNVEGDYRRFDELLQLFAGGNRPRCLTTESRTSDIFRDPPEEPQ